MALINCPECGNEISDAAASCPTCGHRFRAVWRATWPMLRQFVWPAFALFIMLGGGAFLRRTMRADIARRHSNERAALALSISAADACQQLVLKSLGSPAKAKFTTRDGGLIQIPSGDSVLVLGTVEGQNGSRATVRTRFSCGMRRDSTKGVWVGSAFIAAPLSVRGNANAAPK